MYDWLPFNGYVQLNKAADVKSLLLNKCRITHPHMHSMAVLPPNLNPNNNVM